MLPVKRPVEDTVPHEFAAESPVVVLGTRALAVVPVVATGEGAIIAEVVQVTGSPAISRPFWSNTWVENCTLPPTVVAADAGMTETVVGTLAAAVTFTDAVHEKPVDGALVPVVTSAATRTPVPVVSTPSGILAPAAWTADGIEDALTVPVPETAPELWTAEEPLPLIDPMVEVQ
jgi:hypothetical protein